MFEDPHIVVVFQLLLVYDELQLTQLDQNILNVQLFLHFADTFVHEAHQTTLLTPATYIWEAGYVIM